MGFTGARPADEDRATALAVRFGEGFGVASGKAQGVALPVTGGAIAGQRARPESLRDLRVTEGCQPLPVRALAGLNGFALGLSLAPFLSTYRASRPDPPYVVDAGELAMQLTGVLARVQNRPPSP